MNRWFGVILMLNASWYSLDSLKKEGTYARTKGVMANGETFQEEALTCACNFGQLGDYLHVQYRNKWVVVQITDRIGRRFTHTRVDLSKKAFSLLAPLYLGLIPVKVTLIRKENLKCQTQVN